MSTITYIPEYQVVLSRRCDYSCGYCNYPNTPSPPLPSTKQLRKYLRLAGRLNSTQITLSAGEESHSILEVYNTCKYYGYSNWAEYLRALCTTVLTYHSHRVFFPVLDVGRLPFPLLRTVANVVAGVRLIVDSADDSLCNTLAHDKAPHKTLDRRIAGLEEMGRLKIPAFTGTRVGIGESEQSWLILANHINTVQRRYGNIASFAVIPFRPLPYTAMSFLPPVDPETLTHALKVLRGELDKSISICVENPETPADPRGYLQEGLTDIGVVRVGSNEKLNIDAPHALGELGLQLYARGDKLHERLPYLNKFIRSYPLHPAIDKNIALYMERWHAQKLQDEDSSAPFLTPPTGGQMQRER